MSVDLDKRLSATGTRFLIFPQPRTLRSFSKPEVVTISRRPDQIKDGPQDEELYVVDAINKFPYTEKFRPPYSVPKNAFTKAGDDGHFDHLELDTREFCCACTYAIVRRVLDIWDDYIKEPLAWHFNSDFDRLELIPFVESRTAYSGYGYIELGYSKTSSGAIDFLQSYSLNFDAIAHEVGHIVIFSLLGEPASSHDSQHDFRGMHEAFADIIAIIAALHFNSVVDHLLDNTKGNLFSKNELSRVGEISDSREIRVAFNDVKFDKKVTEAHERSLPLSGAIFDILVEVFQKKLVKAGLITEALAKESSFDAHIGASLQSINEQFSNAYVGNHSAFREKLLEARDYLGNLLGKAWTTLSADSITYHKIFRALVTADRQLGGENLQTIRECFAWRKITVPTNSLLLATLSLDHCFPSKNRRKRNHFRKTRKH